MAQAHGFAPRGQRCRSALETFLAGSEVILAGRIDAQGAVLAASPALRYWLGPESDGKRLDAALRPRSRGPWREALAAGEERQLILWFGGTGGAAARYRCTVVPDQGGTRWIWGEPIDGASIVRIDTARERARLRARARARTDPLTGLADRRMGLRRLAADVARARRSGAPVSCLMIDLDEFKAINDRFGHSAGDRALRAATRALAAGLRKSDLAARHGGDEFLVILPGTPASGAMIVAERLSGLLRQLKIAPSGEPMAASVGVAEVQAGETPRGVLERADAALLRAKRQGRGRVELAPDDRVREPPLPPTAMPIHGETIDH